jgi:hypothetical protein
MMVISSNILVLDILNVQTCKVKVYFVTTSCSQTSREGGGGSSVYLVITHSASVFNVSKLNVKRRSPKSAVQFVFHVPY